MSKLTRKLQKIADGQAAVRDRLFDMLVGAANGCSLQDDGEGDYIIVASIGMEQLAGWMNAAKNYLSFVRTEDWPQSWTDDELKERAFHFNRLKQFESLKTASEPSLFLRISSLTR